MSSNTELAEAYRRVRQHLDYNQAYTEIAWTDATLRRVSRQDLARYRAIVDRLEGNIAELRRMWKSGSYSEAELKIIEMAGSHNKTYLDAVLGHIECIERILDRKSLF